MNLPEEIRQARLEMAIRVIISTFEKTIKDTRNSSATGDMEEAVLKFALREGLQDTPERTAKAWDHWLGGYEIDPVALLKCFEDGAEKYDEMVVLAGIDFYSHC